jgi:hypothetical protein
VKEGRQKISGRTDGRIEGGGRKEAERCGGGGGEEKNEGRGSWGKWDGMRGG